MLDLDEETGVKSQFFGTAQGGGSKGDHDGKGITSNGSTNVEFRIPADFKTLVSLTMEAIPETTDATADVDLTSDYYNTGEPFNQHSESDTAITFNFVTDQGDSFDISSVFGSIEANDQCGIMWDQTGAGSNTILGVNLKYR